MPNPLGILSKDGVRHLLTMVVGSRRRCPVASALSSATQPKESRRIVASHEPDVGRLLMLRRRMVFMLSSGAAVLVERTNLK